MPTEQVISAWNGQTDPPSLISAASEAYAIAAAFHIGAGMRGAGGDNGLSVDGAEYFISWAAEHEEDLERVFDAEGMRLEDSGAAFADALESMGITEDLNASAIQSINLLLIFTKDVSGEAGTALCK